MLRRRADKSSFFVCTTSGSSHSIRRERKTQHKNATARLLMRSQSFVCLRVVLSCIATTNCFKSNLYGSPPSFIVHDQALDRTLFPLYTLTASQKPIDFIRSPLNPAINYLTSDASLEV